MSLNQWFEGNRMEPDFLRLQPLDINDGADVFGSVEYPDRLARVWVFMTSTAVAKAAVEDVPRIEWVK